MGTRSLVLVLQVIVLAYICSTGGSFCEGEWQSFSYSRQTYQMYSSNARVNPKNMTQSTLEWLDSACPAQSTYHTCLFHQNLKHVETLSKRAFIPDDEGDCQAFQPLEFANLIKDRRVFFIGDSIMTQIWASVACSLYGLIDVELVPKFERYNQCGEVRCLTQDLAGYNYTPYETNPSYTDTDGNSFDPNIAGSSGSQSSSRRRSKKTRVRARKLSGIENAHLIGGYMKLKNYNATIELFVPFRYSRNYIVDLIRSRKINQNDLIFVNFGMHYYEAEYYEDTIQQLKQDVYTLYNYEPPSKSMLASWNTTKGFDSGEKNPLKQISLQITQFLSTSPYLDSSAATASAWKNKYPPIFFLQSSPQHFQGGSGYYEATNRKYVPSKVCIAVQDFEKRHELDWRNRVIDKLLPPEQYSMPSRKYLELFYNDKDSLTSVVDVLVSTAGGLELDITYIDNNPIKVIYLADVLQSQHDAHIDISLPYFDSSDCTHWCYPSPVFQYYHLMLYNAILRLPASMADSGSHAAGEEEKGKTRFLELRDKFSFNSQRHDSAFQAILYHSQLKSTSQSGDPKPESFRELETEIQRDVARYTDLLVPPGISEGDIVKLSRRAEIYLISKGQKRVFESGQAFLSRGYEWSQVKTISPDELEVFPTGESLK